MPRRLFLALYAAILVVAPALDLPSPPADEATCAAELTCAAMPDSVAFVEQSTEPVKLRLSILQRLKMWRARRPYILVQPR